MVLRGHQHLPVVDRRAAEIRPRVADEVPEDVLLELGLGVRRLAPPSWSRLVRSGQAASAAPRYTPLLRRRPVAGSGSVGVVWAIRSPSEVTTTSRIVMSGYEVPPPGSRKAGRARDLSPMKPVELATLAARLPARPLTRFAPSPTGYLHLGHVANAVWVWGLARALGGQVLLRLEDHDRGRCRPEYEAALLDDLELARARARCRRAGRFRAGRSPTARATRARSRGCPRPARPQEGVRLRMLPKGSRRHRWRRLQRGDEVRRPVPRPRSRPQAPAAARGSASIQGSSDSRTCRLGAQEQEPSAQCGDLLLRDRLGHWTYQFAVVVDDIRQGVDLVIRGEDLLVHRPADPPRPLLGRSAPPVFLHHPLIRKPGGEKLSKSSGDTGIRELESGGREAGGGARAGGLADRPATGAGADRRARPGQAVRRGLASQQLSRRGTEDPENRQSPITQASPVFSGPSVPLG